MIIIQGNTIQNLNRKIVIIKITMLNTPQQFRKIMDIKNKNIKKSLNLFMSSNKLHTHMLLKIIKDKIFTEMKIPILKK